MMKLAAVLVAVLVAMGCSSAKPEAPLPEMAARGTNLTTAKLTRQDLANKASLSGKVTMNPVFGLVTPVDGEVRYLEVKAPERTPTKPTKVATVVARGKPTTTIEVPAGATFSGRLVDDRSAVIAGMPIVSAKYAGYGIVADIDSAQAYKLSAALGSVQAQVKNGPGPFPCAVLGTIAALPAGTVPPPPPAPDAQAQQGQTGQPASAAAAPPGPATGDQEDRQHSDPTGMRLVCTAPADVKLINGASATLEVITERAALALVAPVEAVAGGQGNGKVDVVGPDGGRQTKDVVLGLTDGKVIEIKSGLTGDETLAVPGPNLPPVPQDPSGGKR
jgi:hypothetical protein